MTGYDTHHADLAQAAGEQSWGDLIGTVAWVAAIALIAYGAYFVTSLAFLNRSYRRHERDTEQQDTHADRTDPGRFDAIRHGDPEAVEAFADRLRREVDRRG